MAWETQRGGPWGGGGGGGQGPWGGGGQGGGPRGGPQPPDIEEMLRRSQDKFKKFIPGGGGGAKRALLLLALAVLVWLATGLYRVQPGEEGVELLFGKFVQRTTPGLNYWFPDAHWSGVHAERRKHECDNYRVSRIRRFRDTKLYCPRRFRRKSDAYGRSEHH